MVFEKAYLQYVLRCELLVAFQTLFPETEVNEVDLKLSLFQGLNGFL